jgi:glycosyltransferase involved in cell wall biosynthesis
MGPVRSLCREVEVIPPRFLVSARSCIHGAIRGLPLQAVVCQSQNFDQRLRERLQSERYDIVHVEHLRAAHTNTRLGRRIPTLYDSVDCISLLLQRTVQSSHSLRQRLMALIELKRTQTYEARLLKRFGHTVVTAPDDREALARLAPEAPITVIPNGVDLTRFRPFELPPDPATLVFSGKMSYHANQTAILYFVRSIFPLIQAAHPNVRLRIVGSSPPPTIQSLANDPAIVVTGHVFDLREGLRGATVAICPVRVKVGIQNKILEAMALGIPVVSTPEGLAGLEAQPETDILVGDGAQEFANQVGRLLVDQVLQRQIGRSGNIYVQSHHRWENAARRLEALYDLSIAQHSLEPVG